MSAYNIHYNDKIKKYPKISLQLLSRAIGVFRHVFVMAAGHFKKTEGSLNSHLTLVISNTDNSYYMYCFSQTK